MKFNKPGVAHFNAGFFYKSETFIHNYISHLKRFTPICFAPEFVNADLFSFPSRDMYEIPVQPPRKFSYPWLYGVISRRILKKVISQEEVIFQSRGIRLIHAHFGPQGFFVLKWREKYKLPLITNFYGYDVSELPREEKWARHYETLFKEGDLFLVEGKFMKDALAKLGCPKEKIGIQRIAIPIDKINFIPRKPKKAGETVVLIFTGRFVEKKGLIYVLEAMRKLKDQYTNFELRIIGDGPLKSEIEEFIQRHNLKGHVKLMGFLNYQEYLNEMKNADIFIQPSVTSQSGDTEGGAPTVILEAQAAGMPVIATTHADIPNIVVPGKSALLSAEKDSIGLSKNIEHLLNNQDSWEIMGRFGREFVTQHHDIKKEVIELENKYMALLKK